MPGFEAHRVQLTPLSEVGRCYLCSTQPRGDELQFVSVDNNPDSEAVPAGLIETKAPGAARDTYVARDAYGRGTISVSVEHPQVCSACLTQMGALVGLEKIAPWASRVRELQQASERKEATIAELRAEVEQRKAAQPLLELLGKQLQQAAKKPKAAAPAGG